MIEASWLLFIVASLAVILTPGQDMILVMSRSLAQGPRAGIATAAGVSVGLLGHTLIATLGALGGAERRSSGKLFLEGAISNLSNAKIVVFYLAFLPPFVAPSAEHPTLTVFALGATFAALTFLVKGPVGIFAGALSGWLRRRPAALTGIYRSSGAILIGLGVRLAFERR